MVGLTMSILAGCSAGNASGKSIKGMFSEHNMKAGTCVTGGMIKSTMQEEMILKNFNSITLENAMKPDAILSKKKSIEAGDLVVVFNDELKQVLDWAKKNNMAVRGHTLVWYSQTPEWIYYEDFDTNKSLVSRDVMLARMESYIKQVFEQLKEQGYIELFYAYDVVNEAWMENGKMRENHWLEIIGEDYIWHAFNFANKYAPESIDLYYNDYNEQYKSNTLVNFVKTLVDDQGNYLIDGVGFQAHLYTEDSLTDYFRTLDAVAATGLKVQLTELDVCLGNWQNTKDASEENLKEQGQFYYTLINGLLERVDAGSVKTDAITFWGFMDTLSWRKQASPLLYTGAGEEKPAYYGVLQMKDKVY